MELISPDYRELNKRLHSQVGSYGATSWRKHVQTLEALILRERPTGVLDYGCGKGILKEALEQSFPWMAIQNYDPATFPEDPQPADLVICTDVLEHIEPKCLQDVLSHLRLLCSRTLFVTISTREAKKSLPDGRNAHLIVQPEAWWKERFSGWKIESWDVSKDEVIAILK